MKKRLLTMAALLAMVLTMQAQETTKIMVVTGNDGKVYRKAVIDVKDITFVDESYEYVDLGLPSGTKWATCNVGAIQPQEYGDYFAWGETEPYYSSQFPLVWKTTPKDYSAGYTWGNYFDTPSNYSGSDTPTTFTTYNKKGAQLQPEHDAATANWGSKWRMPTHADWKELADNCYWEWTDNYNGTGVPGYVVYKVKDNADKGKKKFKSGGDTPIASYSLMDTYIFLPAAGYRYATSLYDQGSNGYYWSCELLSGLVGRAWVMYFNSGYMTAENNYGRYDGRSVRAVCAQ